ncbi:lactate utilization protein [bacterium]|nr:lactate utilization protein [bacterium]
MNPRQRFAEKLADPKLRRNMAVSMGTSLGHRLERMAEVPEWEALRDAAHDLRQYGLAHLGDLLAQAESHLTARGVRVFWAEDAAAANQYVIDTARRLGVQKVVKGKTMTSEETYLNDALRAAGLQPVETDLGEYLVQLSGERPTHITAPAVHMSRQDCGKLICTELGQPYTDDPRALTLMVREALRPEFIQSQLGVSGGNFLVAETGTLVICDNEGNQGLVTALSDVHVALVGIDKIVPRLQDLGPLLRLLARNSTGQTLTGYTTLISGPRQATDVDGPRELHIILLDNGRTKMLADPMARDGLTCIRCGVCCGICPIYFKVGGHPYWTYPGATGAVWAPFISDEDWVEELPHICSLCGVCAEACPVKNKLSRVLLQLRTRPQGRRRFPLTQRVGIPGLGRLLGSPALYRLAGRLMRLGWPCRKLAERIGPIGGWTHSRELPTPGKRTFQESWRGGRRG